VRVCVCFWVCRERWDDCYDMEEKGLACLSCWVQRDCLVFRGRLAIHKNETSLEVKAKRDIIYTYTQRHNRGTYRGWCFGLVEEVEGGEQRTHRLVGWAASPCVLYYVCGYGICIVNKCGAASLRRLSQSWIIIIIEAQGLVLCVCGCRSVEEKLRCLGSAGQARA